MFVCIIQEAPDSLSVANPYKRRGTGLRGGRKMSTVPPGPAPPLNPLPWEARETRGLLPAFFDTLGLLVTRPSEAWARMRQRGDTTSPLIFGTAICWLSMALQGILFRLIPSTMLPGFLERRFGSLGRFGGMGLALRLVVAPFV